LLPQRSKHPREKVITPKASTSKYDLSTIVERQHGVGALSNKQTKQKEVFILEYSFNTSYYC